MITAGARMRVKVCGRTIGSASGWDEPDSFCVVFYDFKPTNGFPIVTKDLFVDFERGVFGGNSDEMTQDMIPILNAMPKESDL